MAKVEAISYEDWQERFHDERSCIQYVIDCRWPEGWVCPQCGSKDACFVEGHHRFHCKSCRFSMGVTVGTLFEHSNLPLTKWFDALLLNSIDKGGISASRLSKLLKVTWNTARLMLSKIRQVMGEREADYTLDGYVELDDAFIGGVKPGKRGRGAAGKTPILVACQNEGQQAGFIKIKAVTAVNGETVEAFSEKNLRPQSRVVTDGLAALNPLAKHHAHFPAVTPPKEAHLKLPWVHRVIANLKRYLLGTYHGVSAQHLQEYLDEFCYRFNRRRVEAELPVRLLHLCLNHSPIAKPQLL